MGAAKVLLVDDNVDFLEGLEEEFREEGFVPVTAISGKDALRRLDENPDTQVILTDIRMPDGDGVFLLDEVKRRNSNAAILLFLTGISDITPEEAYNRGAAAIFDKPPDLANIFSTVRRLLLVQEERWKERPDRHVCDCSVALSLSNLQSALGGHVLNIGQGGMFVQMRDSLPKVDQEIGFSITFDGSEGSIVGEGVVRWVRRKTEPIGFGVEFVNLKKHSLQIILGVIAKTKPTSYIPKN